MLLSLCLLRFIPDPLLYHLGGRPWQTSCPSCPMRSVLLLSRPMPWYCGRLRGRYFHYFSIADHFPFLDPRHWRGLAKWLIISFPGPTPLAWLGARPSLSSLVAGCGF